MCVCIRKFSSFLIILNATTPQKRYIPSLFPERSTGYQDSKYVTKWHPFPSTTTKTKHFFEKVYGLFCMEILQTCMLSSDSFHWLVDGWGHLDILENYYMSWFDVPIMVGIISCTVHSFFAWRIYILSKSFILPAFIFTVSGCFVCLLISGF